jgi:hypothetical protein
MLEPARRKPVSLIGELQNAACQNFCSLGVGVANATLLGAVSENTSGSGYWPGS